MVLYGKKWYAFINKCKNPRKSNAGSEWKSVFHEHESPHPHPPNNKSFPKYHLKQINGKKFWLCREGKICVLVYVDVSSSPAGGWQHAVSNCTATLLKLTCERISCMFRTQKQTETTTFTSVNISVLKTADLI